MDSARRRPSTSPAARSGLGLVVALERRWPPDARGYGRLAAAAAASSPDAVYVSGLLDGNAGQLIRDLRSRLPAGVALIGNDGLLPISRLFAAGGDAAQGMYVSIAELPIERLPQRAGTSSPSSRLPRPLRAIHPAAVYAAQAADVLLDAIARSDGSRASVVAGCVAAACGEA